MIYTKKKIIIVFESLSIGGIETKIVDIANNLSENNNVEIFLKNKNGHLINEVDEKIKLYSPKININKLFKNIIFPFWLAIKFKQKKPNIVISFGDYSSISSIFAKNISFTKCKNIISEDSSFIPQIYVNRFSRIRIFLIKKYYSQADAIIVQSNIIKKRILSILPNINNKIYALENWLPLKFNVNNKYNNKYDLIFIARLVEQKNPLLFIEIVNKFIKEGIPIKTVMICSGPLQKKVISLINQYNLLNYIEILPPDSNKNKLLQQSKIFISTSTHEGFPLTILEASFFKCCPLCYQIEEIEDFFKPYKNELLFKNKNEAFTKINNLLKNDSRRNKISNHFYKKTTLSQQKNFLKTIKLIENI